MAMVFDSLIIFLLLLLNTVLGKFIVFKVLVNLLLIYSIANRSSVLKYNIINANKPILLLALLLIISLIRSNNPNYDELTIVYKIYFFIIQSIYLLTLVNDVKLNNNKDLYKFIEYIVVYPFALFCIINFVLYTNNIAFEDTGEFEDLDTGESVILASIGIRLSRVIFPLSNGLNALSTVVGAIFTITGSLIIIGKRLSVLNVISMISFIVILLMIDSRMAIFSPLLIFIILLFRNKIFSFVKLLFNITPYLFVIIPLILLLLLPFLNYISVSREGESLDSDFIRFIIWGISLKIFTNFNLLHLIGYGEYGHYGSGASKSWEDIFVSWGGSKTITAHNAALSLLFDIGYIGFVYFIIMYRSIIKSFMISIANGNESVYILWGFLIYTSIAGSSESSIGFYVSNYLFYFMILCFLSYKISSYDKVKIFTRNVLHPAY